MSLVFHAPLLRGVGRILVDDGPPKPGCEVVLFGGDRQYDRAAELIQSGVAGRVQIIEPRPWRIQQLGAIPRWEDIARRELRQRNVAAEQIGFWPGPAANRWQEARLVRDWLREHPSATVVVLTDRFTSRHDRLLLDRSIDAADRGRVRIMALPHREYDETNWWRRKSGVLAVFNAYLHLGHAWLCGESPAPPPRHLDDLDGIVP